ncbi:hypothetical protein [Nocardia sp. CC227C]|nr:hypothetical protein [Nocardia sp. CC227C]
MAPTRTPAHLRRQVHQGVSLPPVTGYTEDRSTADESSTDIATLEASI